MKVSIVNVAKLQAWRDEFANATGSDVVTGLAKLALICDDIVLSRPFGWLARRPSRMTPAEFAVFMGRFFPAIMANANAAELVAAVESFRGSSEAK